MLSDLKRAYSNALARRELYVELTREDPKYREGWVGRWRFALNVTSDAAQLLPKCLAKHLLSIGFERGKSNRCVDFRASTGTRVLVHGHDFALAGMLE